MSACRDNLEWLSRATNWAKFTATASLGCIHNVSVLLVPFYSVVRLHTANSLGNVLRMIQFKDDDHLFDVEAVKTNFKSVTCV